MCGLWITGSNKKPVAGKNIFRPLLIDYLLYVSFTVTDPHEPSGNLTRVNKNQSLSGMNNSQHSRSLFVTYDPM